MQQAMNDKVYTDHQSKMAGVLAGIRLEFEGRPEELIPVLQKTQAAVGFLPEEALLEIARFTKLSPAEVFGTATFYSQFRLKPVGKQMIRVCRGTACHVKGGARILREVEKQLGIKPGENTADFEFGLETVACIGACALAPTLVINSDTYGQMTSKKVGEILRQRD
ncbi:MAG: NADH-quinone oxidoreductase subunit NuoE [Desulfobacterales bacterium]|nr:NADH-quinone oxidoreductase subunit NuoE [Desulfobacterales bacterium]